MAVVSAPGKLVMIGGYSVLERPNVSWVIGFDKRVTATAKKRADGKAVLKAPQFGIDITGTLDAKNAAITFPKETPEAVLKSAALLHKAVELACGVLASQGVKVTGIEVETISDPAFGDANAKSGLGSSAAVTVAAIGAVFEEYGKPVVKNVDLIHRTSQMAHSLVQGKVGSGIDVAASCFGSCKYTRYSPEVVKNVMASSAEQIIAAINGSWDCTSKPIKLPESLHFASANFVGESTTTSDMLKKVNAWKAAEPEEYGKVIKALDAENGAAINALERGDLESFRKHFVKGRAVTKKLGIRSGAPIEPDDYTELIEASERHGAFCCKLPGAGGGDSIAALCLTEGDKLGLEKFWSRYSHKKLDVLQLGLSNVGVRAEKH